MKKNKGHKIGLLMLSFLFIVPCVAMSMDDTVFTETTVGVSLFAITILGLYGFLLLFSHPKQ